MVRDSEAFKYYKSRYIPPIIAELEIGDRTWGRIAKHVVKEYLEIIHHEKP